MEGTHGNCGNNISKRKRVWNYGEQKRGQWKEHYWEHVRNTIEKYIQVIPLPNPQQLPKQYLGLFYTSWFISLDAWINFWQIVQHPFLPRLMQPRKKNIL